MGQDGRKVRVDKRHCRHVLNREVAPQWSNGGADPIIASQKREVL